MHSCFICIEADRAAVEPARAVVVIGHHALAASGPKRQRVAVCRALYNNPTLVLADEPTGNLDPDSAGIVLDLLAQYTAGGGTVLMATHSDAPESRAGRTLWLRDGTLHIT